MSNYNNNKPFESIMDKLQKKTPKVPPKPTLKDKAVRKPNAVPPKTRYIKMQDGGEVFLLIKLVQMQTLGQTRHHMLSLKIQAQMVSLVTYPLFTQYFQPVISS